MEAVFSVRIVATADASLAAILERSKFGIAIAAMIRMIATTINNSINEKPFCLFRILFAPLGIIGDSSIPNRRMGNNRSLNVQCTCQLQAERSLFRHNTQ